MGYKTVMSRCHDSGSPQSVTKETNFNQDFFSNYLTGGLSSDESCRRLVPDEVWQRLRYYFPSASEFPAAHSACRACQVFDFNSHWLWFTMTLIYLL